MLFARWRARRANRALIEEIHGEIVAAARAPELYRDFAVPDDLDGRFEMVIVHAGLVLRRLGEFGEPGTAIAQEVVDRVFTGFDDALREMSISDVGVAKRMKSMAESFYGRSAVYNAALAALNVETLAVALQRNVYRAGAKAVATPESRGLAARVFELAAAFEAIPLKAFEEKGFRFPAAGGMQ